PGNSPQLAAIVARSLLKDPKDRYPSMRAFIEALDNPQTADLSILNQEQKNLQPWWQATYMKGIGVAVVFLAALIALSVALQSLR
ncbi:MAG: hypothetical protein IH586_01650, partial [Anaerolineaceae bacterium]|nr:hypothetical protein [Anaerolineaceae bacterium]